MAASYLWDTFVLANEQVFLPWRAVGVRLLVLYHRQGAAQCCCSYVSDQMQDKLQQEFVWWTFQVDKYGVWRATPNPVPRHHTKDESSCGIIQWLS